MIRWLRRQPRWAVCLIFPAGVTRVPLLDDGGPHDLLVEEVRQPLAKTRTHAQARARARDVERWPQVNQAALEHGAWVDVRRLDRHGFARG